MKKVETADMSAPSGDSIMAYEQGQVAERVARNTAHDSKLAAKRMGMGADNPLDRARPQRSQVFKPFGALHCQERSI
jgi:hypothetical protein